MREKIKSWIRKWLEEEADDCTPKKNRDLRAVCFSSKDPIDGKHYNEYLCHCTEWTNGEGYNFDFSVYNQLSKRYDEKRFSLCDNEVELLIACMDDMGRFEL